MAYHGKSRKNLMAQKMPGWLIGRRANRRRRRRAARLRGSQSFQGLEMLEMRQLMSSSMFGDFNGDGFDDMIIGVPSESIGIRLDAGAVNVIYGSAAGLTGAGNQGFSQNGAIAGTPENGDRFGAAIAVGNFNGDAFDDVAIGAPGEGIGAIANAGAVNILYGSAAGLTSVGNQMWYQGIVNIIGASEANDRFGAALAAGDFDGDGFTDVAIGVPGESIGTIADAGAVNVIYGSASGLTSVGNDMWHQDTPGIAGGSETGDNFGSVLAVGDFNNDRFFDLGIGVPREDIGLIRDAGAVNVIYGSATGLTNVNDDLWHQNSPGIRGASQTGDRFGSALAAGDFDGNGSDDLAIGGPGEDIGTIRNAGAVNVIYGGAGGLASANDDMWHQNSPGIKGGSEVGDQFGWVLATGDFDGNGKDDLAIGGPGEDIGTIRNAGAVNVIYGTNGGLSATDSTPFAIWSTNDLWHQNRPGIKGGAETGDSFGAALMVGDFNGDGKDDMGAGVPGESIGTVAGAGAVNVIYGSNAGLTGVDDDMWHQNSPGIAGAVEAGDSFGAALDAGGIYPLYSEFDVEVRFTDNSLTASQQAVFSLAANRWSQLIIGDIPDVFVAGFGWVDDVVIDATAAVIDGAGVGGFNIVGQAGPTFFRGGSFLPARGTMTFDVADIVAQQTNGTFFDLVLHEMGHVLGFGAIWNALNLIQNPVQFNAAGVALPPNNPQFTGANATNEFNALTGGAALSVPVENVGGLGTVNSHWRQTIFPNDILNGIIGAAGTNPISRLTTAAFWDMGYVVNLLASDGA